MKMKKIVAETLMILMLAVTICLTACDGGGLLNIGGKETECEFCGETKKCMEKTIWGEEYNICNDCQEELGEAMNAEPASGLSFEKCRNNEKGIYYYQVTGPGTNLDKNLVIPATYKDLPVMGINNNAFEGCAYLTSVVIPKSVTFIDNSAFLGCKNLTRIIIPDSVEIIYGRAFQKCTGLKKVVIGDGVKDIDASAFRDCTALAELKIGKSVEIIENDSFGNCTSLEKVSIPASVQTIEKAFYGCTNLREVEILNEMAFVYGDAFSGCDALATVKIGKDVTIQKGTNIGEVYVPSLSMWLENKLVRQFSPGQYNLFVNNEILQELVIPEEITEVSYQSAVCLSLTKIVIPDHVTSWNFSNCINVTELQIGGGISHISERMMPPNVCHVVIGEGVTELERGLFQEHKSLKTIRLPGTLVEIPYDCFRDCHTLTEIHMSEGLACIKAWALAGCPGLKSIRIPGTVEEIGEGALSWNSNLEEIYIGKGMREIGIGAFWKNPKLEKIVFENTNGWKRYISLGPKYEIDVSDPAKAVALLTSDYYGCIRYD